MRLIIFGAGGLGKEVAELAKIINAKESRWDEMIFQDDVLKEGEILGLPVYDSDSVKGMFDMKESEYVVALGEPKSKEKIYSMLMDKGARLANIIAPDAQVSEFAELGNGIIVKKGSIIQAEARIMDNVTLQSYVAIGHEVQVGEHCQISTFSVVGGKTTIGRNTYISMNCSIKDNVDIGEGVIVSPGSAVLKNIEPNVTVAGNPARVIRRNTEDTRVFH